MSDIIYKYFIKPIITGEGYNPVNTTVYAIGFLVAIYLTKIVFEKLEIEINEKWFKSIFLISIVGGFLRAIEDWITANYGINYSRFLFVTPGIYFVLAGIILLGAWMSRENAYIGLEKLNKSLIGILAFIILAMLITTGIYNVEYVVAILVLAGFLGYFITEALKRYGLARKEDFWIVFGHSLDGSATSIALSCIPGYFEQHVVTNALISSTNPFVYLGVKVVLAILAVVLINKYMSDEREWAWILRLFITVIGLGPGTRDTVRILMGV